VNQLRRGYLLAGAAYLMWGFFPPYYKLLRRAGPIEILAHRVLWSLVFVSLLLGVLRRGRRLVGLLRQPRMLAGVTAAAVLIAVNWGMYIYAVISDHIVEASLGYFINPLLTVLLGVVILRERLRRPQWVALGVGAVAVAVLTVDYGRPPWIALTLAASFGSYGLIKKWLALPAAEGLVAESAVLTIPALAYVAVLAHQGRSTFGTVSALHTTLLIVSGLLTAVPLLCFAGATNRIPLSGIGIMQYITPTIQFGFGVLVYREALPPARAMGFGLVWLALAIFTVDSLRSRTPDPAVMGRSAAAGSPSPSAARP
jgi:chloramphenicol-sensitive protein RarD